MVARPLQANMRRPLTAMRSLTVRNIRQAQSADPIQNDSEPDQFARDIAEIERAAAALREGEPDLEPWTTGTTAVLDQPKPRSVWLFVGAIWITTVLVTGAATLAITSLL